MHKLFVRGGLSLLGMAVMLGWWTYGPKGKQTVSQSHIPSKVEDGGHKLEIETESSSAATMRVSFDRPDKPAGEQQLLDSWEKIPAGSRSWNIDVPSGVGGYIELQGDSPKAGDKLTMRIRMDGKLVDEQSEILNAPLEPNTAFFVQDYFDDYSTAHLEGQ